jgi:hypothetical protein
MRISSKNKRGDDGIGLKIAYIGLKIGRPLVRV